MSLLGRERICKRYQRCVLYVYTSSERLGSVECDARRVFRPWNIMIFKRCVTFALTYCLKCL